MTQRRPTSAGINTAIGNYCRIDVDLGGALSWARAYNSRDETVGVLGRGWTHSYADALSVRDNGHPAAAR